MTTYYRTSGKTERSKCDNCGRPFKEHKYVSTDRDGELHRCPRVLKRSATSGRLEFVNLGKNTRAAEEVIRALDSVKSDILDLFKLGRFACKKQLANGAVLKVEIKMPPLAATKKARRARR